MSNNDCVWSQCECCGIYGILAVSFDFDEATLYVRNKVTVLCKDKKRCLELVQSGKVE